MSRLPRRDRTDGRRKGYQHHRSPVSSHLSPEILERLLEMRGPVRKSKREKPERKAGV